MIADRAQVQPHGVGGGARVALGDGVHQAVVLGEAVVRAVRPGREAAQPPQVTVRRIVFRLSNSASSTMLAVAWATARCRRLSQYS